MAEVTGAGIHTKIGKVGKALGTITEEDSYSGEKRPGL